MFARLFRLSDRYGRLIVKIGVWAGDRVARTARRFVLWLRERIFGPELETESTRVEMQVRSLSGLIVMLLASVVLLVVWATGPQGQDNPVVRFFSIGPTAVPADASEAPDPAAAAQNPPFLELGGTVVFSMYAGAQQDLFALAAGQDQPTRLTDDLADDRDPVWSPDGSRIAFSSRRDGNWELYTLEVTTGQITRLTFEQAYDGAPTWSPDGQWIAYESYANDNLDIYLIKADVSEGPYRVTYHPAPDFDPAWTTDSVGRSLVYISRRDGSQDIYTLSLDDPSEDRAVNLTNTPDLDEGQPAWGPDGQLLAYSVVENGQPLVRVLDTSVEEGSARLVGQGYSPTWSPDGSSLIFLAPNSTASSILLSGQLGAWDTSVQAVELPAVASSPDWSAHSLPEAPQGSLAFAATAPITPAFQETLMSPEDSAEPYRLINLAGVVAESPWLNDRVDDSFTALRVHINQAAGWDFLGRLDHVWWPLERPSEPGQDPLNWHKAGRAFDIVQAYNEGAQPQIELVPEQIGPDTYWRLYVRASVQDGSLGEPLRSLPWDFSARTGGDVAAYEAGGRFRDAIPAGYYVDFTRIAGIYGWNRIPSDASWRYNWPGILYWQYENRGGLDWWTAMLELYPESALQPLVAAPPTSGPAAPLPTATEQLTMTPTSTPTPTPTLTPTPLEETPVSATPTLTPIPQEDTSVPVTPTLTPSSTATPEPSELPEQS
jgi:TolB protein